MMSGKNSWAERKLKGHQLFQQSIYEDKREKLKPARIVPQLDVIHTSGNISGYEKGTWKGASLYNSFKIDSDMKNI